VQLLHVPVQAVASHRQFVSLLVDVGVSRLSEADCSVQLIKHGPAIGLPAMQFETDVAETNTVQS
jgi:hypothetical protein